MAGSYQNGGARIKKIEELGTTPEALNQKKKFRQCLFTSISAAFVIIFLIFIVAIKQHTSQPSPGDQTGSTTTPYVPALDGGGTSSSVPTGCESTIMILRHCEKIGPEVTTNGGEQHCSYVGHERAHFLPTLFGPGGWPVPSALYALGTDRGDHHNFREIETLQPLADKYGLKIDAQYSKNEDLVKEYFKLLNGGKLCGKLVLVSWKHQYIGDLARALSCPSCPKEYDIDEFDEVWQIKYVYDAEGALASKLNSSSKDKKEVDGPAGKRMLKGRKESAAPKKQWTPYFTRSAQRFDPLKFSALMGDYNGTKVGGSWLEVDGSEM